MKDLRAFLRTLPSAPEREVYGVLEVSELEFWDFEVRQTTITKAILFEVESEKSEEDHAVVLTIHPRKKEWTIWCVSTKNDAERVERATGKSYDHNCYFWKRHECPHTRSVAHFLVKHPEVVERIEDFLGVAEEVGAKDLTLVLVDLLRVRKNVFLFGETGGGKTHAVLSAFRLLHEEGEYDELIQIDCTNGLEDVDLLGKTVPMTPDRKVRALMELKKKYPDIDSSTLAGLIGDWDFEDGELHRAFVLASQGKRVLTVLEEITRGHPKALNLLVKAMDPVSGVYRLWNFVQGEVIEAPIENLVFVATANMGYSGTEDLDEALLDRFQAFLHVTYDEKKEREILKSLGVDEETAKKMTQVVKVLREKYRNGYLSKPFSTRLLKNWGEFVANGMDPVEALQLLHFRIVDVSEGQPDDVQLEEIRSVLRRVFG